MDTSKDELMVTIRCLAYNHEPYIRQCLEGFIMQKTNFRFEAIVHDDASTDGTAAIIREYAEEYPDIIKPIFEIENKYSKRDGSISRIMDGHTHGKYVAMCEGDDYWIDPLKLQKQVDFLEKNPEYVMVYTNAKIYYQTKKKLVNGKYGQSSNTYEDFLRSNPIPTLTVLYKKSAINDYDIIINPGNKGWLLGDYPLWLWLSLQGKIKFIPEYTSVYRFLNQSASHFKDYAAAKRFVLSSISVKEFFMNLRDVECWNSIYDYDNHQLFDLAFSYRQKDDINYYYKKIVNKSLKDWIKHLVGIFL